ncbi:TPR domain-containing protein [Fusarium austroafricanum]|uniref:TPR domain-containing protein n=1 Tax=Fusarium austroafricanum TaxID=2364996 RepID=A0A8H4K8M4_9HYPO|nr:TPR domain-containing protein [Fusarium austroafricanum]
MDSLEGSIESLSLEQLDELIDMGRQAVAIPNLERPLMFTCLSMLTSNLRHRMTRMNSEDHFNEMIEYLKRAKQLASPEDEERIPMNCFLASVLFERYRLHGRRDDLLEAIETCETIIPDMSDGPQLQSISSKLCYMYWARYELDHDIEFIRLAVAKTPDSHADRRGRLSTLSNALHESYKTTKDETLLEEAIQYGNEALKCAKDCSNEIKICLFYLGDMQFSKYKLSRDRNDVDQARADIALSVKHFEEAAKHIATDDINESAILVKLGDVLGYQFEITKRREDINRAIEKLERGVELKGESSPTFRDEVDRLYFLLFKRYQTTEDLHDLQRALYHAKRILATNPGQGSDQAVDLFRIGHLNIDLFNATGDDKHLDLAVEYCKDAVSKLSPGDSRSSTILSGYATALAVLSKRKGEVALLDEALDKMRMALHLSQPTDPHWAAYLTSNAKMLQSRFTFESSAADLGEAVRLAKEAKKFTPRQSPEYTEVLTLLCSLQAEMFSFTQDLADIDAAIQSGEESLTIQHNGVQKARCLINLSNALFARSESRNLKQDIDAAIDMQTEAASDTNNPMRPASLSNLANILRDRYFRYGDQADLDAAVEKSTLALSLFPLDHPQRVHAEGNLGIILQQVYLVNGSMETLDRAIHLCESAIETINNKFPRHRDRPRIHNHLGGMRYAKFERRGLEEDLNKAVDHGRAALEYARLADPVTQIFMVNLAEAVRQRFDVFGRLEDIQYAIALCKKIVDATASNHPRRATRLNGLSKMLYSRYKRTLEVEDLESSIKYGKEAKSASSPSRSHWAGLCYSLGSFICTRFENTGSRNDIEEAFENMREAVDRTPRQGVQRDIFVASLGSLWHQKYQKFDQGGDLDQAIKCGFEALETAPVDSPRRAMLLFNLGRWLGGRFLIGRDESDRDISKCLLSQVLHLDTATAMTRARAGTILALQCINDHNWQKAYNALEKVIELLPRISPRTLARDDQQHMLKEFSETASLAASCALQIGKSDAEALEILESGRGIISSLMINQRNDVTELKRVDHDLATEYELLRDRLSQLPMEGLGSTMRAGFLPRATGIANDLFYDANLALSEERRAIIRDLENLERYIRKTLPGFERFQLSLSADQMKTMASTHPIVSINASSVRTDAFLVTSSEIRSIKLPNDTHSRLLTLARKLIGSDKLSQGPPSTLYERNEELQISLEWLWATVVEPILNSLKEDLTRLTPKPFSKNSSSNLPRLLWVTNGIAGLCPLHAAGKHEGRSKDNTASHVISSYVTSFKALSYAKDMKIQLLAHKSQELMIASMPQTIGQADISADEEAEAIKACFENLNLPTPKILSLPSKRDVLEALKTCNIAHFACHGVSNPIDPSKGALLLADAIKPGTPDRLTIHDLLDIQRNNSQIAYLSACSTAENAAESLLDETVHLASTFQLVGFPHVIGTMWEANDKAAIDVARVFYKKLIGVTQLVLKGEESTELDGNYAVAFALHEAVRLLKRVKRPGSSIVPARNVLSWAPFVHIGI